MLKATENKFGTGDLFTNGENHRGKTSPGEFKVTTPENQLLLKHVVKSKRNLSTQYQPTIQPLPQYPIGLVM